MQITESTIVVDCGIYPVPCLDGIRCGARCGGSRCASSRHARLPTPRGVSEKGEVLPLPFLRYRRVKIQGRGRVGDRSTVPLLLKL
jgi:hypothetical protein